MAEILKEGPRLRLRRAEAADIDYICALQEAKDNSDYIVPFSRADHETIVAQSKAAMDIIVEERSGGSIGYLHIAGLLLASKEQEWTHVIIGKKGHGAPILKMSLSTYSLQMCWLPLLTRAFPV